MLSRARCWLQPVICRAANVSMAWWRMEAVWQVGNPALLAWLIAGVQGAGCLGRCFWICKALLSVAVSSALGAQGLGGGEPSWKGLCWPEHRGSPEALLSLGKQVVWCYGSAASRAVWAGCLRWSGAV